MQLLRICGSPFLVTHSDDVASDLWTFLISVITWNRDCIWFFFYIVCPCRDVAIPNALSAASFTTASYLTEFTASIGASKNRSKQKSPSQPGWNAHNFYVCSYSPKLSAAQEVFLLAEGHGWMLTLSVDTEAVSPIFPDTAVCYMKKLLNSDCFIFAKVMLKIP